MPITNGADIPVGDTIQGGVPHLFGVEGSKVPLASGLEDVMQTASVANRPDPIDVEVEREIRPAGMGSRALPPLPNPDPTFCEAAKGGID